jgi:hypothetical protein
MKMAKTMLTSLRHAMTGNYGNTNANHHAYDIVSKAAELDKIFRMSKADLHVFITRVKLPLVGPPSFGFDFDHQTMEITKDVPLVDRRDSADRKPVVGLAISPGIIKAGNSDGENYGSERVLAKLQALCNIPELLEYFENHKMARGNHDQQPCKEESSTDDEVDMLPIPHSKH